MISKDLVIKTEKISKCYRIGSKEAMHDSFSKSILGFIRSPLKNYRKYRSLYRFDDIYDNSRSDSDSKPSNIFWALKDVSFDIKKGETVGLIGGNGAGKSTLLKILSRITSPTNGYAEFRGRVSSLLEVGTGFHPELTGRENVYLNGTILGMRKSEINLKFDEIVEFSGVEKFIDTPVKRYSSGMKVRLAFAVAAHLEPEILIIDEVLAVGDAEFQNKCLGKMKSVAKEGRTIVFVSHNMSAINQLCSRAIWIDNGQVRRSGTTHDIIESYLSSDSQSCVGEVLLPDTHINSESKLRIKSVRILSNEGEVTSIVDYKKKFKIEISYELFVNLNGMSIMGKIDDVMGNIICVSWDTDITEWKDRVREPGQYTSTCNFPGSLLQHGRYILTVGAFISGKELLAKHDHIISFEVSPANFILNINRQGIVAPLIDWEVKRNDE